MKIAYSTSKISQEATKPKIIEQTPFELEKKTDLSRENPETTEQNRHLQQK